MKVYEAMTPDVVSVAPDATLQEAAEAMRNLDVGPLPVCQGERLVGMITDRDITIRATALGHDPRSTRVRDVMTPEAVCCLETDEVDKVARLMQAAQLRRLLVVSAEGRLVGIVSLGDIAVQARDDKLTGETLERVSEPSGVRE